MSEQLDQSRIEELFAAGAASESAATQTEASPTAEPVRRRRRHVTVVDFSRPSTFSKEQERRLRRAHEVFCRSASTQVTGEARTPVDFEVLDVRQLTWSNAVRETGTDVIYSVVRLGQGSQIVLALERLFVLTLIDRMCGGTDVVVAGDRKLSEIDVVLTEGIMRGLIEQLSRIWNEWFDVALAFEGIEQDARGIQVAQLAEPTVVVTIELWLAKHTFLMTLMLPHAAVKEASATFLAREASALAEDPTAERAMRRALGNVAIELRARVASLELSADELLALDVGDTVHLGPAAEVTLYADDVPLHRGAPGRDGAKRAIQIGAWKRP
ncbi:MAG: FliM/FliN family flagellar motor switch protein [Solirubrobacteraceae bacterium]|jgi:flagellar motor switch protein FliM